MANLDQNYNSRRKKERKEAIQYNPFHTFIQNMEIDVEAKYY